MRDAIERANINLMRREQELDDLVARSQGNRNSRIGANLRNIFERPAIERERERIDQQMDSLNRKRRSSLAQALAETGVNVNADNFSAEDLQKLRLAQLGRQVAPLKGASTPSSVLLANEIQKARQSGDTRRLNDLLLASKSFEKGQVVTPEGNIQNLEGFVNSLSEKKKGEKSGELEAKLELEPSVATAVEAAKIVGKEQGISQAELDDRIASFPRMLEMADELSALGKKATFTKAGQAANAVRRQLGLSVGEAGVARADYISKVDNEILPLLRQTFGAQFTENEGKSLRATLGDPDVSPEEKDAVLRSFIAGKTGAIETLSRRTGEAVPSGITFEGFE